MYSVSIYYFAACYSLACAGLWRCGRSKQWFILLLVLWYYVVLFRRGGGARSVGQSALGAWSEDDEEDWGANRVVEELEISMTI